MHVLDVWFMVYMWWYVINYLYTGIECMSFHPCVIFCLRKCTLCPSKGLCVQTSLTTIYRDVLLIQPHRNTWESYHLSFLEVPSPWTVFCRNAARDTYLLMFSTRVLYKECVEDKGGSGCDWSLFEELTVKFIQLIWLHCVPPAPPRPY